MVSSRDSAQKERTLDIEAIMKDIREKAKKDVVSGNYLVAESKTATPSVKSKNLVSAIHSEELRYLNAHWHDWVETHEVSSHRKFFGKFIVKAKEFVIKTVWDYLLKDYIDAERKYNVNLVRYLNTSARYLDSRVEEIFCKLISKIDSDIVHIHNEVVRTEENVRSTFVSFMQEIRSIASFGEADNKRNADDVNQLRNSLSKIDEMIRGLERSLAMLSESNLQSHSSPGVISSYIQNSESDVSEIKVKRDAPDLRYYLFENRFRGSEEDIRARQERYAELFVGIQGDILEIGCGRGELLDTFRSKGLQARGVDIDTAMAERALEKGLRVEIGDAFAVLENVAESSLGGVVALQFVEHLSNEQLHHLLELCACKLAVGGKILFETINPKSFAALACNFFRDPTHRWPLHPDTLQMLVEMNGLKTGDVIYSSPYPTSSLLTEIPVDVYLPARWRRTLETLNDNMRRLNGLLFDYQDYAIVAEKV